MKRLWLIVVIILLQIISFHFHNYSDLLAQDIYFGIKAGPSIPSLKGGTTEQSKGYRTRIAPDIGILSSMEFKNQFALQLEISYVGQGGVKIGNQLIPAGMLNNPALPSVDLYGNFKNSVVLNYIEVPILVKYSVAVDKLFDLFFDAGPNTGFLISAKTKTSGSSQIFTDLKGTPLLDQQGNPLPPADFDKNTNIKKDLNTINFGITGGAGIVSEFETGELLLELRGSYGLTDIQKDPANGKNHTGCLTITIGYRIYYKSFKKKR
jgi:hypothetical protein